MTTPLTPMKRRPWHLAFLSGVLLVLALASSPAIAGDGSSDGHVSVTVRGVGSTSSSFALDIGEESLVVKTGETREFTVAPGSVQLSISTGHAVEIAGASCAPDTITIDIAAQSFDGETESHARSVVVEVAAGTPLDCLFVADANSFPGARSGAF